VSKKTTPSPATLFRAELLKIMPGYSWTLGRTRKGAVTLIAVGIQSSGFNRLSTLEVRRTDIDGHVTYTVRSAGYGRRAPWLHAHTDGTLARALRGLQDHYEDVARTYRIHASDLQQGRKAPAGSESCG